MFTATRLQAVTYLLGVCLFSISFLVFLNSSVSFVITDLIGQRQGVGNAVGTLGFADELVALVACPAWGVLSDRVGLRTVCVLGYAIVGSALFIFVQAKNVYPQLLLARLFFSIGGAATSTMVTAVLPSMIAPHEPAASNAASRPSMPVNSHVGSASISSELTITPQRFRHQSSRSVSPSKKTASKSSPTRLAGFVGLFTGCGALVALTLFLPLPAMFQNSGLQPGNAVAKSFYVVGGISFVVSVICFLGLRNLYGEEEKGWGGIALTKKSDDSVTGMKYTGTGRLPPLKRFLKSIKLGYVYPQLGLGYFGGFVARASSVGISLFIPLYVNAYFMNSGLCSDISHGSHDMKSQCQQAYILAAKLTGVSQLVALLFAPVFGYLADRYRRFNAPLLAAALFGIVGYSGMALLRGPEPGGKNGTPWVFLIVAMLGISQIGAIVCSLGLVGSCVLGLDVAARPVESESLDDGATRVETPHAEATDDHGESEALLQDEADDDQSYSYLKGSIAGVYSLAGGAGILLLTKLGGLAFDDLSPAAPFYLLGLFNILLLMACVASGISLVARDQ
ncbi:hypothetical protein MMC29_008132 [Sticta canariensis]|nr:hypothetical protein [Sticta canariensis]